MKKKKKKKEKEKKEIQEKKAFTACRLGLAQNKTVLPDDLCK